MSSWLAIVHWSQVGWPAKKSPTLAATAAQHQLICCWSCMLNARTLLATATAGAFFFFAGFFFFGFVIVCLPGDRYAARRSVSWNTFPGAPQAGRYDGRLKAGIGAYPASSSQECRTSRSTPKGVRRLHRDLRATHW